jgi:hypothetical protein
MSTSVLPRVLLVVAAVAALAWLATSLRATNLAEQGEAFVQDVRGEEIVPEEVRHGRDLLRRARRFSADLDPRIQEGFLLILARRPAAARVVAKETVDEEPENASAWYLAYLVAQASGDEEGAARALRELRVLNPLLVNRVTARRQ